MVTRRNIVIVYLLTLVTFGFYLYYWLVKTKDEFNGLGAAVPTGWLLLVPVANLYWIYRYCEAFSRFVKKDDNAVLWFLVYLLAGIIMPAIVQSELNRLAG